jgi:glutaminyl-tRNA synthetase
LRIHHPQQIEFARLNLTHTVLSKRKLLQLVQQKHVAGWDDPRMPTLAGIRRRGYTPEAIRAFCERIGVAKRNSTVDIAMLEHCLREDLNRRARRVMAVLRPLKVVIENYPEGMTEELVAVNNPEDASMGTREVPFSRVLYIERDDFREEPPKGFFRLSPGKEVRLRYAYIIKCLEAVKDPATGLVTELRCVYDPETKSGSSQAQRKVKATIHWVSAEHALSAEARLYDHLFSAESPDDVPEGGDWLPNLNPKSLEVIKDARVEPVLARSRAGELYQFERLGYFCLDRVDSEADRLIFNRTVTLRDTWAKIERSSNAKKNGGARSH